MKHKTNFIFNVGEFGYTPSLSLNKCPAMSPVLSHRTDSLVHLFISHLLREGEHTPTHLYQPALASLIRTKHIFFH